MRGRAKIKFCVHTNESNSIYPVPALIMSEMAVDYNNVSDGDDTGSDAEEDGCGNVRYHVPALRKNILTDVRGVLRDARRRDATPSDQCVRRSKMTKYEFARLRSMRIAQLENGAIPLVQHIPPINDVTQWGGFPHPTIYERIFYAEALRRRLPYIIARKYHDGKTEYVRASRLDYSRWLNFQA